jgi:mRNA interferase MazF
MIERGGIYLTDFGRRYQSDTGKRRPAVVLSAQSYLDIVDQLEFPSILVLPLTTRTVDNPANLLRVRIPPRGGLERPSEIIINWSCSVDLKNLDLTDGPLTVLETAELRELEEKFALYCGMGGG